MTELTHGERRQHPSLFGPIVLITIGVYFLLARMNLVSELHWWDVLGLWPLLLIFLGLNVLALQAPRPLGTLLSGLVALLAVGVFGYILLFGLDNTPLQRLERIRSGAWQTEPIALAADGVQTADVDIQIGPPGANLYALEDSRNLIEGQVTYTDDLLFETSKSGGRATVRVEPRNAERWFFFPGRWRNLDQAARWQLGLNPSVETALSLSATAGSSRLDLRGLALSDLAVNASAGDVKLFLPDGDYNAELAMNATSAEITLPESGRHTIELNVNAGAVTLYLPPSMVARIEVDRALGTFDAADTRLRRVSGDEASGGVWETAGSASAQDRVDLIVHIAVGSVTIRTP